MQNENINGLNIFGNTRRMQTKLRYVIELMETFDIISTFSGHKPNKSKCKIVGLCALKVVKLAF